MTVQLTLDLPWLQPTGGQEIDGLVVRRGRDDALTYEDGIALHVHVLDPTSHGSAEALVEGARAQAGPGRVVLVAGAVPVAWRSQLREAELSFFDVSGVAEIFWPRLRVSAVHFGRPVKRRRSPVPLQKGSALVTEELLIVAMNGGRPTIGDLAAGAAVSLSTASRTVSQLAERGLVAKDRHGTHVSVALLDRVEVAERLAQRTAWPGDEQLGGYLWGRTIFDVAQRISTRASEQGLALAVTGRVGAAFHGVLGTSAPAELRCWVGAQGHELSDIAGRLGLEPAPAGTANVMISSDPWRVGIHHRAEVTFDEWSASTAHPLRVWCDLHGDQRGAEFAAQLWGTIVRAG